MSLRRLNFCTKYASCFGCVSTMLCCRVKRLRFSAGAVKETAYRRFSCVFFLGVKHRAVYRRFQGKDCTSGQVSYTLVFEMAFGMTPTAPANLFWHKPATTHPTPTPNRPLSSSPPWHRCSRSSRVALAALVVACCPCCHVFLLVSGVHQA